MGHLPVNTGIGLPEGFERKTYYQDEDFRVYLEYFSDQLFVHVHIHNFNRDVLKRIKEQWSLVMIDAFMEGFENVFAYTKDNRIIKMIGNAIYIETAGGYEVWKWELK